MDMYFLSSCLPFLHAICFELKLIHVVILQFIVFWLVGFELQRIF